MDQEIKNGNPLWLLLALPVFFLVWWLIGIGYAFIAGPGALALIYVVFVWLPDDQARKVNRKLKFGEARKLLRRATQQVKEVGDRQISKEIDVALLTLEGLIDSFESKSSAQGKIEVKVVPMLQNLTGLLDRWLGHESGKYPLEKQEAKQIRGILIHFDDLILKYQKDGIDSTDTYMTGLFELETDMQSAGIDPEGDNS